MFASFFLLKNSELFVIANIQVVYICSVELLLSVEIKLETRSPIIHANHQHKRDPKCMWVLLTEFSLRLFVRKMVVFRVLLQGCWPIK